MTYIPASRDFEHRPRNRHAALRTGSVWHGDDFGTYDVHRLSVQLVRAAVLGVVCLGIAVVLPSAFAALGDVTAIYETLSPTGR